MAISNATLSTQVLASYSILYERRGDLACTFTGRFPRSCHGRMQPKITECARCKAQYVWYIV